MAGQPARTLAEAQAHYRKGTSGANVYGPLWKDPTTGQLYDLRNGHPVQKGGGTWKGDTYTDAVTGQLIGEGNGLGETLRDFGILAGATLTGGALAGAPILGLGGGAAAGGGSAAGGAAGGSAAGTAAGTTAATTAGTSIGSKILSGAKKAKDVVGDVSNVAGNIAAGRASGRAIEATQEQGAARDEADAYQRAIRQALLGSVLKGAKDVSITPPEGIEMGTITGGARPSAIANKDELAELILKGARGRLANPPNVDYGSLGGKPNAFDKILGAISTGGALLGAAAPIFEDAPLPEAPNMAPLPRRVLANDAAPRGLMSGVSFGDLDAPESALSMDPRYRVRRPGGVRF